MPVCFSCPNSQKLVWFCDILWYFFIPKNGFTNPTRFKSCQLDKIFIHDLFCLINIRCSTIGVCYAPPTPYLVDFFQFIVFFPNLFFCFLFRLSLLPPESYIPQTTIVTSCTAISSRILLVLPKLPLQLNAIPKKPQKP